MLRRANKQLRLFGVRVPSAAKTDMFLLMRARLPESCLGYGEMYLDWRLSIGLTHQGWATILDKLQDPSMTGDDYAFSFKVSYEQRLREPVALRAPKDWRNGLPIV